MKVNRTALRTIEILEYIAKSQDGVSLLEIAQALDIPKSSVFDILKTLLYNKSCRYGERNTDNQRCAISSVGRAPDS